MKIANVRHKGLRQLLEDDDPKGLRPDLVPRIRRILTVLVSAQGMNEVKGPPGWRIHRLSGDRSETWSISVSGNWRITFRIEDDAIQDLDLEDYH
ncbi:type II toxin-antitoxin system RelE/ParE family toxin [Aquisalimonas sp.]|uniref:type II toxin-antitoxin system RelE/ParE family toxin n=1 Tax=Aquisalimonas sp. TaxID=1872621 RepID=UPI0025B82C97|nr:type II toxin-antitoxin system RelE/ParE family toxin [Aquisalimonas sp.]